MISQWKVNGKALYWYCTTLTGVAWRKRGRGIRGWAKFLWLFSRFFVQTLYGLVYFGRRFRVFAAIYAWFRRVDDTLDGDAPLPRKVSRSEYLANKQHVMDSLRDFVCLPCVCSGEDALLRYAMRTAGHLRIDLIPEIATLWRLVRWDSERRLWRAPMDSAELYANAAAQDACILAFFVKVFDGEARQFSEIVAMIDGALTRIDWLRDFAVDLQKGAVNMPREAAGEYGIDVRQLLCCTCWEELNALVGFRAWFKAEADELTRRWESVRRSFGVDFGSVFPSRSVAHFLWRSLVAEFDCSFQQCASLLYFVSPSAS